MKDKSGIGRGIVQCVAFLLSLRLLSSILRETQKKNVHILVLNGCLISLDSAWNMLRRVLKRAGLPRVHIRDLRHTFATLALQNGVDIKTVSSMLGHYSAGFTLDTYTHVTTPAQMEAANTMGSMLTGAT